MKVGRYFSTLATPSATSVLVGLAGVSTMMTEMRPFDIVFLRASAMALRIVHRTTAGQYATLLGPHQHIHRLAGPFAAAEIQDLAAQSAIMRHRPGRAHGE